MAFKLKRVVSTSKPLELLNLKLFAHTRTRILDGNYYGFVILGDYSKFTWTLFLVHEEDTFKVLVKFAKRIQNLYSLKIVTLHNDHGGEFVNHQFENFYN